MSQKSSSTINEIGTLYMSGMNERISMHFQTTIELRLSQVRAMKEDNPVREGDQQALRDVLAYNAEVRGFDYLALYSRDGRFDMLYGEPVEVLDQTPFLRSLNAGEDKIAVGNDASGNKIVLLGVSAEYLWRMESARRWWQDFRWITYRRCSSWTKRNLWCIRISSAGTGAL